MADSEHLGSLRRIVGDDVLRHERFILAASAPNLAGRWISGARVHHFP